ncbi:3-hexulose-6-phosphate isomerase [Streptomyces sp. PBH53]|uniref:3-hydroxybutyrate oligomer hydrolase family protein n=1 Tax=Streptomyces sp. PBH53 TaxID=1577075 RepID=UPI000654E817|nr:3-hydroxybutyrate oligomer hydrolase family protein [Streptomyces sp. PBH53]AKN73150.1 3-hexulose-6-phosphate isomerase [Streptomyces sp. PBH53]
MPPHRTPARGRRARRTALGALSLAAVCSLLITPATAAPTRPGSGPGAPDAHCAGRARLHVPGAAHQQTACLAELTTAGTVASGHTDPADYAGLTPKDLPTPTGVPGIQIDGYFPDTSATNTNHGWHHDAQFVIRLPDHWNGGLVVAGTPGNREQYANDRAIADWVLARGYAYAATDKGNTGTAFHRDGRRPGDALAEWNARLTQLTRAAHTVVTQRYHRPPARTLATGLSNGGYLVRWQLENHPELYDGGVDWEGTLWRADGPNPLTSLPAALRHYPAYAAGGPAATEAGTPYCASGTPGCDADYDYAARPAAVHRAVGRIALTGRIGKPLITLQGTLDVLLPISEDSDVYHRMVHEAGRGSLLRYYRIEDGTHTDALADAFPDRLRPMVPCHRSAFAALERWLAGNGVPPADQTVPRPSGAAPATVLTSCPLS